MAASVPMTGSRRWSAATVAVALAAGGASATAGSGLADATSDIAFVMGVMAASLYWSVLIVAMRTDASESRRCAALIRGHVRYTMRTCAVAVAGILSVAVGAVTRSLEALGTVSVAADAVAVGALALFLLRVLAIVGSFSEIVDARMEDADRGREPDDGTGRSRWRRPAEDVGRG